MCGLFFFRNEMRNTCELWLCCTLGQGRERVAYPEIVSDLLQTPSESLGDSHHRLHVVADGKPSSQPFEEGLLCRGEGQGGKQFEEITKVVAADRLYSVHRILEKAAVNDTPMEGDPPRLVREHQSRRDHELGEIIR